MLGHKETARFSIDSVTGQQSLLQNTVMDLERVTVCTFPIVKFLRHRTIDITVIRSQLSHDLSTMISWLPEPPSKARVDRGHRHPTNRITGDVARLRIIEVAVQQLQTQDPVPRHKENRPHQLICRPPKGSGRHPQLLPFHLFDIALPSMYCSLLVSLVDG